MRYVCKICGYEYDESRENTAFGDLPETWACPVCGVGKEMFAAEAAEDTPKSEQSESTLSEVLVGRLADCGLKWVFGMVGHSNLGVADAVRKLSGEGRMNFIGIRHEGAAAFACSGYGKLTGRPAACLSIAGPGATNLMTGLYDAKLDGAPAIALMGQVPGSELGYRTFQEIDLTSVFADAVCSSFTLSASTRAEDAAEASFRNSVLNKAPAQIVLPDDAQTHPAPSSRLGAEYSIKRPKCVPAPDAINEAAAMIAQAKAPAIVAGAGCIGAEKSLAAFAGRFGFPVATTYRAKGVLPDSHPLACGVVGRSGTAVSGEIIRSCDLIIGLGTSFSRHSEIPKDKKTLQLDCDPAAFGRIRTPDFALLGDMSESLPAISAALEGMRPEFASRTGQIESAWAAWREEKSRRAKNSAQNAIDTAAACLALSKYVPENAIVSVDVGNVAYAFGRYFEAKSQTMLLSFYLGSIGVGLPSAMGAWCASREAGRHRGRPVVAVVGDGGIGQYLAEWTTAAKYGMDIKCVVFNNSELAKISLEQRNARFDVWETSLKNPGFAEFARLCGTGAVRISDPSKLDEQLRAAFSLAGPVLIEITTAP